MENLVEQNTNVDADRDREIAEQYKDIPGWGMDADPRNNPTYPMKNWTGADHQRFNYDKPVQQPVNIEILKSIERPAISRVFGTSTPPQGLSGAIRRYAFKYNESTYMHWVPLALADRVGVVEGIIDDFKHGTFPNIWKEKGLKAEWKYNREGMIKNAVVTVVVAAAVITLLRRKRK